MLRIAWGSIRLQSLYPSACPLTGSLIGTPSIQRARSVEWSELNPRSEALEAKPGPCPSSCTSRPATGRRRGGGEKRRERREVERSVVRRPRGRRRKDDDPGGRDAGGSRNRRGPRQAAADAVADLPVVIRGRRLVASHRVAGVRPMHAG